MVLRLKTWESRSPPNLKSPKPGGHRHRTMPPPRPVAGIRRPNTALSTNQNPAAGWSSPVARQAHNLKVVGSNPTPATKSLRDIRCLDAALRGGVCVSTTPWKHCGSKRGRSPSRHNEIRAGFSTPSCGAGPEQWRWSFLALSRRSPALPRTSRSVDRRPKVPAWSLPEQRTSVRLPMSVCAALIRSCFAIAASSRSQAPLAFTSSMTAARPQTHADRPHRECEHGHSSR
jgi:hypothetical protein